MRFDIVPVTDRDVLVGSSRIERVLIAVHIENMGSFVSISSDSGKREMWMTSYIL